MTDKEKMLNRAKSWGYSEIKDEGNRTSWITNNFATIIMFWTDDGNVDNTRHTLYIDRNGHIY